MVALELLATDAYLTLAAHLVGGRLDPVSIEPDWTASRRERDLVGHLEQALASGRIAASIRELEPDAPAYGVLKEALAMYRQAAKDGGWRAIAAGPALRLGDRGERVSAVRQRLRMTGLLEAPETQTDEFDSGLETAVAAFQRRVGLEADGIVGAVTLRELNKRPTDRIDQVRANLERWRWLPEDLGRRHVRVNIADYRLEARRDGRVEQVHDVIVGRTYRRTPVFSGEISYVVFNPWWETPPNLARQDKLPAFRKDPASVERLGFEVIGRDGKMIDPAGINWADYSTDDFPFRLRQRPGPLNALGQVKLMFPNRHNVYLHDTPSRELFARGERAFSSGCVRVADALALTEWVLEGTEDWTRARIDAVVAAGREIRVNLASRVPVHILYFTAVTDADGSLRLISDVYGRDARLIAALGRPPPAGDK
jgi:murein L,D-transpeptidase YcbB/YkuD